MNIKIIDGIEPAKELLGTVIVIDVFRASNTILAALSRGAKKIYVASDEQVAADLLKKHPDSLYFGEHMGDKLSGADYTNSPSETYSLNLANKTIVFQTTMGSRAIVAPAKANEILVASFGNAAAIADYLKESKPKSISFVACGEVGDVRAVEDYECAKYIEALLKGEKVDFEAVKNTVLNRSNGAKRLKDKDQKADLEICLRLDYSQMVPYAILHEGNVMLQVK